MRQLFKSAPTQASWTKQRKFEWVEMRSRKTEKKIQKEVAAVIKKSSSDESQRRNPRFFSALQLVLPGG